MTYLYHHIQIVDQILAMLYVLEDHDISTLSYLEIRYYYFDKYIQLGNLAFKTLRYL